MNEILRAMIVDDEAPARLVLRQLLTAHPNVKLVGEANSGTAAVDLFMDLRPDVIFLDVQMPGGDGFSILPKLQPLPAIVFVTAYDEYAVRAFEVNAIPRFIVCGWADLQIVSCIASRNRSTSISPSFSLEVVNQKGHLSRMGLTNPEDAPANRVNQACRRFD